MTGRALPGTSGVPRSVPLSEMIKLGKLVPPKCEHDIVFMEVEAFDAENACWSDPMEVKLQLANKKFSIGGIRDADRCTGKSNLVGNLVLKRYRPERISDLTNLFSSLESHTRKVVQMHSLACYFVRKMKADAPPDFGIHFLYTELYYGKLCDEYVTLETFIPGMFKKYVNNTGDIVTTDGTETALKAETFVHYTYVTSNKQLMVLDLQGCDFSLCDPEIASTELYDTDQQINFCAGNLSVHAMETFLSQHVCNKYCRMLKLCDFP